MKLDLKSNGIIFLEKILLKINPNSDIIISGIAGPDTKAGGKSNNKNLENLSILKS